jgi:hypothetical protein
MLWETTDLFKLSIEIYLYPYIKVHKVVLFTQVILTNIYYIGTYLMFSLYEIPVYSGLYLDRFNCTVHVFVVNLIYLISDDKLVYNLVYHGVLLVKVTRMLWETTDLFKLSIEIYLYPYIKVHKVVFNYLFLHILCHQ